MAFNAYKLYSTPPSSNMDVEKANARLADAPPEAVLRWAVETFGDEVALSSSFQTQSVPLLHMVSRVAPELRVLFLDTGFHFPETLAFRDRLVREWGLKVETLRRRPMHDAPGGHQTHDLYRTDPDLCCHINKVEPMRLATRDLRAWVSGVRRDQSPARAGIDVVEQTAKGIVRVHPMASWTQRDIFRYIADHDLPEHPLLREGYLSVGCAPCTRPVAPGGDERSGRWAGQGKTECGLHTDLREGGRGGPETERPNGEG